MRATIRGYVSCAAALTVLFGLAAATAAQDRNDRDYRDGRDTLSPVVEASMSPAEQASYLQRQTDGNAIGLVITNYGFFGNNFVTRAPSMEYPLGSQIDHLIRAGLWVGAINANGDTVVSTGCISGSWGGGSASVTEFNPTQNLKERSTLISSRAFSKKAVSEQDFAGAYRDYGPIKSTNRGKALTVSVTQRSYLWSYKFAEAFVLVSFTVKNEGEGILRDLRLGIFGEMASGWKGAYDTWRPSGWFRKKALEYFPSQRMIGEHHYTYQGGTAPSWGAFALLGTKGDGVPAITEVPVLFNWWDWYSEQDDPGTYTEQYRFKLMGADLSDDISTIVPEVTDPVELLSAGPFPEMVSGDSVVFVCAFLGGMDRASLIQNAQWAQRAFDNDYVLPSPPQPPRFKIAPESGAINLFWDDSPESSLDPFYKVPDFEGYRVYVTRTEGATSDDFELVRDVDKIDSIGYDTGFDSIRETNLIDTTLYTYRLRISDVKDGFRYWVSLTSYDRGMPDQGVESMQSGVLATRVLTIPGTASQEDETVQVFPNPYRGEAVWDGTRDREKYIWFVNLPRKATIRIFTLAGDLVKTLEFDAGTYTGADVQGLKTSSERLVAMPGGICAWDLISNKDQAVATGLYVFSVENRETGKNQVGKLVIIR
jgi:hypothetical protein